MTQIKDLVESREYLMPQLPMMQQIEENLQTDYESAVAVFNEVVAPKLEQPEKKISQLDLQAFEASSTEDIAIKNAHALFRNSPGAFDQYKQQMIALASDPNLAELYKGLQSKYNVMMEAAEKDRKDYRNIIAKKDAALMELNSQLSEARKACKELKQGAEAFAKDITKLRNELAFVGLRCEQYEDEIKPIITVENEEIQVTGRKYRPVKRSVKPKIA